MSIASKRTKKEKRLKKEGIKIPIYCPNCNVSISETIYDMKRPWEYIKEKLFKIITNLKHCK